MKNAIILHGMPSKEEYFNSKNHAQSNKHWLSWIQKQLTENGISAQAPELPEPYEPDYEKWKATFEQFNIDKNTILVGHSCGGGFLVRWLGENNVQVDKVALVAPWIDPNRKSAPKMFDGLQIKDITSQTNAIQLFISSDDDKEELDTAQQLKQKISGLVVREFKDRGHFTFGDMKTDEFPELLDFLLER